MTYDDLFPEAHTYYPYKHWKTPRVQKMLTQLRCQNCGNDTAWTFYDWLTSGSGPMVCSPDCASTLWNDEWSESEDPDFF